MELTLTLPPDGKIEAVENARVPAYGTAEIAQWLRSAMEGVSQSAAAGDDIAVLAGSLASADEQDIQAFASRVTRHPKPQETTAAEAGSSLAVDVAGLVYHGAAQAVEAGSFAEAGIGLTALLGEPEARPRALLGLAVCAARLGRFDEALRLALESQGADGGLHPRAYYVAGLSECERGNRREAQTYLVRASRLARRDERFGEDLRMAQRLLLLIQIGISEKTRL